MGMVANSPGDLWRRDYRSTNRIFRRSLSERNAAVRPVDLNALLAIIATGCLITITIAVGHIAGWW